MSLFVGTGTLSLGLVCSCPRLAAAVGDPPFEDLVDLDELRIGECNQGQVLICANGVSSDLRAARFSALTTRRAACTFQDLTVVSRTDGPDPELLDDLAGCVALSEER